MEPGPTLNPGEVVVVATPLHAVSDHDDGYGWAMGSVPTADEGEVRLRSHLGRAAFRHCSAGTARLRPAHECALRSGVVRQIHGGPCRSSGGASMSIPSRLGWPSEVRVWARKVRVWTGRRDTERQEPPESFRCSAIGGRFTDWCPYREESYPARFLIQRSPFEINLQVVMDG